MTDTLGGPRSGPLPYLDRPFIAMAHRGGWIESEDEARENTRYAFSRAVQLGYEYLETDVRTTADGQLVVFHDPLLDRVSDATGPVSERTWADLADVRIAGTDPIARLEDVLEEFPSVRFNLDLKDPRAVEPLAELVRRTGVSDRVCVASFSGARLAAFRRLAGPDIVTAVTPAGVAWYGFVPLLRRLPVDAGQVLQVPARVGRNRVRLVRRDMVAAVHAAGRLVHVWTVDDVAEAERLLDLGVDGLITNRIAPLKELLQARGLWRGTE